MWRSDYYTSYFRSRKRHLYHHLQILNLPVPNDDIYTKAVTCITLRAIEVIVSKYILYIYLLTAWCRVLLEKLTGLQLVKKFPAFHGTRRFITALTSVRQLSLSWASPIQSIYPHPTSWRPILILSTHLRLDLPSDSFPPVSPPIPYTPTVSYYIMCSFLR